MEEKKESIGTRYRIVRKSKGMNQCDFANLLGISQAYLSSIETGRRKPKLEVVQSLADLGFPIKWIMEGADASTAEKQRETSRAQRRRDVEFITAATDEMDDQEVHFVKEWISLYLDLKDNRLRDSEEEE